MIVMGFMVLFYPRGLMWPYPDFVITIHAHLCFAINQNIFSHCNLRLTKWDRNGRWWKSHMPSRHLISFASNSWLTTSSTHLHFHCLLHPASFYHWEECLVTHSSYCCLAPQHLPSQAHPRAYLHHLSTIQHPQPHLPPFKFYPDKHFYMHDWSCLNTPALLLVLIDHVHSLY